jgi:amino acid transporter
VKDSTKRLPRILLIGISITALIYVFTSLVSFGVLPGSRLQASSAPMAEVASVYLPRGARMFVTLGAIAAIMTALNGTMLVPSRLAMMFAKDKLAPSWIGVVNPHTATPIRGLTLTLIACALLLWTNQLLLALTVAVIALVGLYFIHSLVFLFLPRLNPLLASEITIRMPRWLLRASAVVSVVSMGTLIAIQLASDINTLKTTTLGQRISEHSLTSIELIVVWGIVGIVLYQFARIRSGRSNNGEFSEEAFNAD